MGRWALIFDLLLLVTFTCKHKNRTLRKKQRKERKKNKGKTRKGVNIWVKREKMESNLEVSEIRGGDSGTAGWVKKTKSVY